MEHTMEHTIDIHPFNETERPSVARGCKEGYERHGYVLPSILIGQIKNLAKYFNLTESAAAEQLLKKSIEAAIQEHGSKCVEQQREGNIFG